MAGALIGCPLTSNIEPWHGQSQHVSKLFQVQMAANMGAACRVQVQRSCLVAVGRDFLQSAPHDRAFAGLQVIQRTEFARSDILGKALQRRHILAP